MKIKTIVWQNRRDFRAIYSCEHCGKEEAKGGYDDDNFHRNVIPKIPCKFCGKTSPEDYRPLGTKYPEGMQI
jgi:hypothetical protein